MIGSHILHLKETSSTNTNLKDLLQNKILEEGFTIYADYQNGGRGQKGNTWESCSAQNLLFSMVLYPNHIKANEQFLISQMVSLAIKHVLDKYLSQVSIKWPNDIYWQDKKLAGILIENSLVEDSIEYSVIGVGVNVNQEIFQSNAPNPVSLKLITGRTYNIRSILEQITEQIQMYYQQYQANIIRDFYKKSLYRKDGYHKYFDKELVFLAQIEDIEDSGLLVLKQKNGSIRKFAFKEVQSIL